MPEAAVNRRWVLRERPTGPPTADLFELQEQPVPELEEHEVLVKVMWLAMDAGAVGRLRAESSYAASVSLGDVMFGIGAGLVVASRNPEFDPGSYLAGSFGWQEWAVVDPRRTFTYPARRDLGAPLQRYLGFLGISGATAYFGLLDVGRPVAGETVLVSAAAGGVGTLVGQLARNAGCRVVGIAGSQAKCDALVERFGYDAAIAYRERTPSELTALIGQACPDGVDVYFDNVGGDLYEAVLPVCNTFSRVVVCGRLAASGLTDTTHERGLRDNGHVLVKRMRKEGFLVFDHMADLPRAQEQLLAWHQAGKLHAPEQFLDGLERTPEAFVGMLAGENLGRQLVRITH